MFIKRLFILVVALFSLALSAPARAAETEGVRLVKVFYAALEDTMKQGPTLGFKGRFAKLKPVITTSFDLPLMTRYAVGPTWRNLSPQDQKSVVQAFSDFSIATYASRFTKYDGETFEVVGEKEAAGGIMVETKLTPKGADPVILNYLVRKDEKGKMRIADVYLDASISELATRRSEFSSLIQREGFNSLVESLKKKAEAMGHVASSTPSP